jgi:hypothetical protein
MDVFFDGVQDAVEESVEPVQEGDEDQANA